MNSNCRKWVRGSILRSRTLSKSSGIWSSFEVRPLKWCVEGVFGIRGIRVKEPEGRRPREEEGVGGNAGVGV